MIRHPAKERLHRLTVKTLDQVFIMRVKEGLGCSQFEAEALTNLIKEVGLSTVNGCQPASWGQPRTHSLDKHTDYAA